MSRNNVRGPTSALTETLRALGITPTAIARRAATRTTQPQDGEQPVAGPSSTGRRGNNAEENDDVDGMDVDGEPEAQVEASPDPRPTTRRRRTRASVATGYASDDLDEPESAPPIPAKQTKKPSKAAQAKLKAKAKKQAKKNRDDDDDDDDDGEDDTYTALSKSMWMNTPKPPVGSFENCAKCGKQFTVTKYTIAANPGPGFLCHPCAKASGTDPFKKPAVPKKRKAPADKRQVVSFEEKRFPSLSSLCIQIISQHIDDVEALGDLNAVSMDEISKTISKNRSLTTQTAQLFYGAHNTQLTLYDATKLTAPAFCTLAQLNPNLTSLRLDFCGCMNDSVMDAWSTSLPSLTRLELLGPFLVRSLAWQKFFEFHPDLEGFLITQSPRFDVPALESLIKNCKGIRELRLKEIGLMSDEMLGVLGKVKKGQLETLDLSEPSGSCSEESMIKLMKAIGTGLIKLDLSGHGKLMDGFLEKGLKGLRKLEELTLMNLPELTNDGVAAFFDSWKNHSLLKLDFSRNYALGGTALIALISHSGSSLQMLNINGWGPDVDVGALGAVGEFGKELREVDFGWCRCVDDFVVKEVLEGCEKLVSVKVWGCNRVTERCPRKRGVSIYGVESHSVV